MTDRYYALTVALEKDIRSDDAKPIMNAIRQIRGVREVAPLVSSPDVWTAYQRVRMELITKIIAMIKSDEIA